MFSLLCLFFAFFIHSPSIYAEQVRAVSEQGNVSRETLLSGCFAEKAITIQPVSPLCAVFSSKNNLQTLFKVCYRLLKTVCGLQNEPQAVQSDLQAAQNGFQTPKAAYRFIQSDLLSSQAACGA